MAKANKENLENLIVEYQPQLKSFIRKRVDNREDAEDILQDVFYQFVKTVGIALNPIEQVSAWLYRVARNNIVNHFTKKREDEMPVYRNEEDFEEIDQDFTEILFSDKNFPSPETEYLRSLVWEELEAALSKLPTEQREIFELTELEGIPVKEIAQTSGIAVNTLLSRKHYAIVFLRKQLKALYLELIN